MLPHNPFGEFYLDFVGSRWLLHGELFQVVRRGREPRASLGLDRTMMLATTNSEVFDTVVLEEPLLRNDALPGTVAVYAGRANDFYSITHGREIRIVCGLGLWTLTIDRTHGTGVVFVERDLNDEPFTLPWLDFLRGCSIFGQQVPAVIRANTPEEDALVLVSMASYGFVHMREVQAYSSYQPILTAISKLPSFCAEDVQNMVNSLNIQFGYIPDVLLEKASSPTMSIWDRLAGEA